MVCIPHNFHFSIALNKGFRTIITIKKEGPAERATFVGKLVVVAARIVHMEWDIGDLHAQGQRVRFNLLVGMYDEREQLCLHLQVCPHERCFTGNTFPYH